MAKLNILEFQAVRDTEAGEATGVPLYPPLATQNIAFTTTTQSAVFQDRASLIRIISDVDCYIEIGENPTATTASMFFKGNKAEIIGIKPGDKLAVYDGVSV